MTYRRRVYELLDQSQMGDRAASLVHRAIMALILVNIAAVVLESVPSLAERFATAFLVTEVVSVAVFTIEYIARLWAAVEHPPLRGLPPWRARLAYALYPVSIVDLLAILPMALALVVSADLRTLLLFRLIRYFKLARYSPGLSSLMDAVWSERRALGACFVILIGAVLVAASLMHLVEHAVQPDQFGSIPAAMYWAAITLSTVGYGDAVPVTAAGKFVAAITAMTGLIMLALPVGIVASAFAREIHRRDFVVTWSMVARVPLFASLDAVAVAEIMRVLKAQTANAGDVICRRGETAQSMYFVASGSVMVELPHGKHVELGEGHFFGEIAVLTKSRRSATVRAQTRVRLLVLDAHDLQMIMVQHPDIAQRIEEVARARIGPERIGKEGDLVTEEIDEHAARGPDQGLARKT